jgi:succinyl-diaminopimelate desuccinylase
VPFTVDLDETAALLGALVSIKSINPAYPGATSGEDRIGAFVLDYLQNLGLDCGAHEVLDNRFNVLGLLPGSSRRGLCLETHLDTMPVVNMEGEPFQPFLRDGRLYGRGSCDAKGSLAAMLLALKLLVEQGNTPPTDIYLAAVVDEEYKYRGVTHLLESGFRVAGVVVGEPTNLAVVTACKGVVRWKIQTHGRAGHSSRPEEGHNAIYDMAAIIQGVKQKIIPKYKEQSHHLLGSPTVNIGCVSGGTVVNIIPDACTIELDRRMLPGETWEVIRGEFEALFKDLGVAGEIHEPYLIDEAMETAPGEPIVLAAQAACRKVLGSSRVQGVSFGCDATKFHRAGIPGIILGPGSILQAHSIEEYVELEEVARAAEVYARLCATFNGGSEN